MTDERWEAIWDGCLDSVRRLLGDAPPEEGLAAVIEFPAPVESEDEPEEDES